MFEIVSQDIFDRLPERYRRRAREIGARVAEINVLLLPCNPGAIRDAALRLCGQLRPQPDVKIEEFADEFRLACADLPEWVVSEATNDFLAGRVENHTGQYMPTCAEFARHARLIVSPFIGEKFGLRNEAERLLERAEDEARRAEIAIERADPGVRERVRCLLAKAKAGAPVLPTGRAHLGIPSEAQAEMDKYRRRTEHVSKLADTPAVKGKRA